MLAGVATVVALAAGFFLLPTSLLVVNLLIGAVVFGVCFYALREVFKRRSGGSASGELASAAHPLRRALRASQAAVLLVAMMFLGSLVLWVGVPVAWLWIGSRLQNGTSLATATGAMMIGMLLSVTLLLGVARLAQPPAHRASGAAGRARGRDDGARAASWSRAPSSR